MIGQKLWKHLESKPGVKPAAYALLFAGLAALGVLFQDITYGELIIGIYGIVALVRNIRSEETFKMALISLGCVPLLGIMGSTILANNFAIYGFLLLCIGIVCLIKQYWKAPSEESMPALFRPKVYISRKKQVFVSRRDRHMQNSI